MQFHHSILALLAIAYLNGLVAAGKDYTDPKSVAVCTEINREMEEKLRKFKKASRYTQEDAYDNAASTFRDYGCNSGREMRAHVFGLRMYDCTREGFEHAKASFECTKIEWRRTQGCMGGANQCSPLQNVVARKVFGRARNCYSQYMEEYKRMARDMDENTVHLPYTLGVSFRGKCSKGETFSWSEQLPSESDYNDCMEHNIEVIRAPILAKHPGETNYAKLARQTIDHCKAFTAKFSDLIGRVRWEWPIYNSLTYYAGVIQVWRAFYACKALIVQPMDVIVYALAVEKPIKA